MIIKSSVPTRNTNVNFLYFFKAVLTPCLLVVRITQSESYAFQKTRKIVYLTLFLYSENSAMKPNYFPSFLELVPS